jgi:hypothetical protein
MTDLATPRQQVNRILQWLFGSRAIVMDSNPVSIGGYLIDYEEIYGALPGEHGPRGASPLARFGWFRAWGHRVWNPWDANHRVPLPTTVAAGAFAAVKLAWLFCLILGLPFPWLRAALPLAVLGGLAAAGRRWWTSSTRSATARP